MGHGKYDTINQGGMLQRNGISCSCRKYNLSRSTLYDYVRSNWDRFQTTQSKLERKPNVSWNGIAISCRCVNQQEHPLPVTGFSKEQVGIFFDLYEKELAAHDYPTSRIFNVDETGVTVVQKKQPKILALKRQTSDWRINCGRKGLFNNNCCMHEC